MQIAVMELVLEKRREVQYGWNETASKSILLAQPSRGSVRYSAVYQWDGFQGRCASGEHGNFQYVDRVS